MYNPTFVHILYKKSIIRYTHNFVPYSVNYLPVILTFNLGRLLGPVDTFSILRSVNNPSIKRPKTTCLPSKNSQASQVIKNWQPFVLGPELAYINMFMI